ncbi:MAG: DUF1924 domain-containing protein [Pseudomonadota bacterium]
MKHIPHKLIILLALAATGLAQPMFALTAADTLKQLEQSAKQTDPTFKGVSAQRGERLFKTTHGAEWSCASCHSDNPAASGKHAKTGKVIAPLAPAANAERFTRQDKVEKWFRRNCNDVLNRACTASEQADVLAYLMSIKS